MESGVTALALGDYHSCALIAGGGVKCWGLNLYGQLGDGSTEWSSDTPVDVVGLASGCDDARCRRKSYLCAVFGWRGKIRGENGDGQLCDGTTTRRNTPVDVVGLASGVTAITAGGAHTCALLTGGGVSVGGRMGMDS